jgi:hypothetical protein
MKINICGAGSDGYSTTRNPYTTPIEATDVAYITCSPDSPAEIRVIYFVNSCIGKWAWDIIYDNSSSKLLSQFRNAGINLHEFHRGGLKPLIKGETVSINSQNAVRVLPSRVFSKNSLVDKILSYIFPRTDVLFEQKGVSRIIIDIKGRPLRVFNELRKTNPNIRFGPP